MTAQYLLDCAYGILDAMPVKGEAIATLFAESADDVRELAALSDSKAHESVVGPMWAVSVHLYKPENRSAFVAVRYERRVSAEQVRAAAQEGVAP